MANTFCRVQEEISFQFQQSTPRKIHFHTLRHWKLTAYAHEIKDPFMVQLFARHKDMKSTGKYIHYAEVVYKECHHSGEKWEYIIN
jgi:integrase